MVDYYAILGIPKTATENEIKAAFRRLAKLYHPDKNPTVTDAKIKFEQILRAYETLIHPAKRRRYDSSAFSTTPQHNQPHRTKGKHQKEWSFTEEELKRRQYYQTYYKSKQKSTVEEVSKTTYTDYKYILLATPLAVALVMLIISMFTDEPQKTPSSVNIEQVKPEKADKKIKNGFMPYASYFGNIKTFDTKNTLNINNATGYDMVIVLFENKNDSYLRHTYLESESDVEFSMLPNEGIYWKCLIGKNWNTKKWVYKKQIIGCFDSIVQIQNWKNTPAVFDEKNQTHSYFLTLLFADSKNKQYISNEEVFFKK